ncbi:MAG: hypothetical protein NW226_24640 [Microscillaceae bacterium]|nr:hypothetical protein [Microscillaceae bacterium]
MKKFSLLFALILGLFFFTSCEDDDDTTTPTVLDEPTIGTATGTTIQAGTTANVTIPITAPGGLASVTVSATAGTATVTAGSFTVGATTQQSVVVSYTAPATAGNQVINVTATDQQSPAQTETGAVVINVTTEPVKPTRDVFASAAGTGTVTWDKDTIYVLRGFIFVNSGQTLTIEAGTIVKGQPGAGSGASALIVARGGKLMAEGTAADPIIMTALSDDTDDPADLPAGLDSQWGSLIVLGKAKINGTDAVVGGEAAIEGIPTTETRGLYGGTDDADNSGVLKYISLRHGGTEIGASNEINGLSLGAVGNATTIDYIEVFSNFDDGYEWFGGTVNAKHLISAYAGDDAIDWDQGFTGKIQYLFVAQEPAGTATPKGGRGCECNGVVNGATINYDSAPISMPTIANATFIGAGAGAAETQIFEFRQGSAGKVYNSIFFNFAAGLRVNGISASEAIESETRLDAGTLLFANNLFGGIGSATALSGVGQANGAIDNTALAAKVNTMLANNNNAYNNTIGLQGASVTVGGLNPLLTAGGAADGVTTFDLSADTFFTTETKIGAFPTSTNWATGWTALDEYGFL